MIIFCYKITLSIAITGAVILAFVTIGFSEIVVFDDATTVQAPIRIKVLTKSRFLARAGRLVDIYLNEKHLKRILTGGDGYGYFKYTPQDAGLNTIEARSDADSASGLHLVTNKDDKVILIDIEGAFKDAIFSEKIRENSREAVYSLSEEYKLIYVSRYVGKGIGRSWLEKEGFPISVILRWHGVNTLKLLKKRGVRLDAVIGSTAVIAAAKKHIAQRYTFEKTKDGKMVKDWDEILNLLKPATPPEKPQKPEDRRQRTEDGGQRTEDRSQRTEARRQKPEDRRQRTEDRGQKPEDGFLNSEAGMRKWEF
jgi:hypothetical protein